MIRHGDLLYAKCDQQDSYQCFYGISADNSAEHVKLKTFLNKIFDSSFKVNSQGRLTEAPIEALFLPYYVAQDVGWVYLRKSFSGLEFYKDFKEDFLDYYLNVESFLDREKKHSLEQELTEIKSKIAILGGFESINEDKEFAKLVEESMPPEIPPYITSFAEINNEISKHEKELAIKCNELSFFQERRSVLFRIKKSHISIFETNIACPVCKQKLPLSIESRYKYLQEHNDTEGQIEQCSIKLKDIQSKITGLKKKISDLRQQSKKGYQLLQRREYEEVTVANWIENKALLLLDQNISRQIGDLVKQKKSIEDQLKGMKTSEEIWKIRNFRAKEFKDIFENALNDMQVTIRDENRFKNIYSITSFPAQGVELHKTIMAYHFSFNLLLQQAGLAHRLPFMLDAIFKEDIEPDNRQIIIKFISKWKPSDTQVIFSIAQGRDSKDLSAKINADYFLNQAKIINIGDSKKERAFLSPPKPEYEAIYQETIEIVYTN